MNEFDMINPPGSHRINPPSRPPVEPTNFAGKLFNGCLTFFLGALFFVGLSALILVAVVGYKVVKQSSDIMPAMSKDSDHVREKIVTKGNVAKKIVIIDVKGIIYHGDGLYREHSSSGKIIDQLKKVRDDPDVVALILDMNTPGGSVTATDEIHNELQKVRKKGIKVLTCMRTIAASGGYYLAAGTDYVIANRLTLTGSIGVIMGGHNYHGLFKKLGLESEVYKSGKFKDLLNMGRPREIEEIELIQDLIDETYMEFAKIVSDGRQLDIDKVVSGPIGDAGIFSGRRAQELGLVDQLGYFDDALAKAKEFAKIKSPTIVRYTIQYSLSDLIFSQFGDWITELVPGNSTLVKTGMLYYLCPTVL